jgi:hypothetical protein
MKRLLTVGLAALAGALAGSAVRQLVAVNVAANTRTGGESATTDTTEG